MAATLTFPRFRGHLSSVFYHVSHGVLQSIPVALGVTLAGIGSTIALKSTSLDPFLTSLWAGVVSSSLLTGVVLTSGAGLIEPHTKKFAPILSKPARRGLQGFGKMVALGGPFLVAMGIAASDVNFLKQDQIWQTHPAVQRITQLMAN